MKYIYYSFICLLLFSCTKETPRPVPTASFTWTKLDNGTIQFTDQSTEGDTYEWEFGENGQKSTEKNPKFTYSKNAVYTVKLTVSNPSGSNSVTKTIDIANIAPFTAFTYVENSGTVTFTNKSTNADTYLWDFGDNTTSTEANPTHKYKKNGTYNIKMIATGPGGSITLLSYIDVKGIPFTINDVIDDPSLASFLVGTWGAYVSGSGRKFDNYVYEFSMGSPTLSYRNYYNQYEYISSTDEIKRTYKFKIEKNIIYDISRATPVKEARIERISDDEMKIYTISESATTYREYFQALLTRVSNLEKPMSQVVLNTSIASILSGKWGQDKYSIWTNIEFDFSANKNYYQYSEEFQGAKSTSKYEFKIDADGTMSYRRWNSSFIPNWEKTKFEIISPTEIRFAGYRLNKK